MFKMEPCFANYSCSRKEKEGQRLSSIANVQMLKVIKSSKVETKGFQTQESCKKVVMDIITKDSNDNPRGRVPQQHESCVKKMMCFAIEENKLCPNNPGIQKEDNNTQQIEILKNVENLKKNIKNNGMKCSQVDYIGRKLHSNVSCN